MEKKKRKINITKIKNKNLKKALSLLLEVISLIFLVVAKTSLLEKIRIETIYLIKIKPKSYSENKIKKVTIFSNIFNLRKI